MAKGSIQRTPMYQKDTVQGLRAPKLYSNNTKAAKAPHGEKTGPAGMGNKNAQRAPKQTMQPLSNSQRLKSVGKRGLC